MVITAEDLDLEVTPGAFDCTHWIEVGGVAYSCDLAPEEHKTNSVGCTIHGTHTVSGHVAETYMNRSPWSLQQIDLVQWLAGQNWSPETRKSFRSALKSFYGWGRETGHIHHDPTVTLRPIHVMPRPPRPVPDEVFECALARANSRDKLILLLAGFAGLRITEISQLKWSDVQDGRLRIKGKGGRLRFVPIHERLDAELAQHTHDGPWLFPGQLGPITPGHVGVIARRALGGGWSAHTLRHRFASRAYAGTHDLLAVQQLLGHADPATTKRYTQLADETLTAAVRSV